MISVFTLPDAPVSTDATGTTQVLVQIGMQLMVLQPINYMNQRALLQRFPLLTALMN